MKAKRDTASHTNSFAFESALFKVRLISGNAAVFVIVSIAAFALAGALAWAGM